VGRPERPADPSDSYANPYSAEHEADKLVAFQEGVVSTLRMFANIGKTSHYSIGTYRAMHENDLKQMAVNQARVAIEAANITGDPNLQQKTQQLLSSTDQMPSGRKFTREQDIE
jgi:hypothetical protein